jgi:hypothetical protein
MPSPSVSDWLGRGAGQCSAPVDGDREKEREGRMFAVLVIAVVWVELVLF